MLCARRSLKKVNRVQCVDRLFSSVPQSRPRLGAHDTRLVPIPLHMPWHARLQQALAATSACVIAGQCMVRIPILQSHAEITALESCKPPSASAICAIGPRSFLWVTSLSRAITIRCIVLFQDGVECGWSGSCVQGERKQGSEARASDSAVPRCDDMGCDQLGLSESKVSTAEAAERLLYSHTCIQ